MNLHISETDLFEGLTAFTTTFAGSLMTIRIPLLAMFMLAIAGVLAILLVSAFGFGDLALVARHVVHSFTPNSNATMVGMIAAIKAAVAVGVFGRRKGPRA